MTALPLNTEQESLIDGLVELYTPKQLDLVKRFLDSLHSYIGDAKSLAPFVHSVKRRVKDLGHLKDSLTRKLARTIENGVAFDINRENVFQKINDLGGYRILHLHTRQFEHIHAALVDILAGEAQAVIIEGPNANVWDDETETYFKSIGVETRRTDRMYASVHYVVRPNNRQDVAVEIQVRTLSEEIWGEVDHKLNYPYPIDSVACREQIRVLARIASGVTRLVDSIFASYEDWQSLHATPRDESPEN